MCLDAKLLSGSQCISRRLFSMRWGTQAPPMKTSLTGTAWLICGAAALAVVAGRVLGVVERESTADSVLARDSGLEPAPSAAAP